jgi:hypothetical protein
MTRGDNKPKHVFPTAVRLVLKEEPTAVALQRWCKTVKVVGQLV